VSGFPVLFARILEFWIGDIQELYDELRHCWRARTSGFWGSDFAMGQGKAYPHLETDHFQEKSRAYIRVWFGNCTKYLQLLVRGTMLMHSKNSLT